MSYQPTQFSNGVPQPQAMSPGYPPPQQAAPMVASPQPVRVFDSLGMMEVPPPPPELVLQVLASTDIELKNSLREQFPDEEMQKVSFGLVPTHKAYVRRLSQAGASHVFTVMGQSIVEMAGDIWALCLGRLIIMGVGISDAVGAASFRDKALLQGSRGVSFDAIRYAGYHPSRDGNKSDLDNMWPQFMKLAQTNAFDRSCYNLGVGVAGKDTASEDDWASMPPPPPAPTSAHPTQQPHAGQWGIPPTPQQPWGQALPVAPQPMAQQQPMVAQPAPQQPWGQALPGGPQQPMAPLAPPTLAAQPGVASPQMPPPPPGAPDIQTLTSPASPEMIERLKGLVAEKGMTDDVLQGILANLHLQDLGQMNVAQCSSVTKMVERWSKGAS